MRFSRRKCPEAPVCADYQGTRHEETRICRRRTGWAFSVTAAASCASRRGLCRGAQHLMWWGECFGNRRIALQSTWTLPGSKHRRSATFWSFMKSNYSSRGLRWGMIRFGNEFRLLEWISAVVHVVMRVRNDPEDVVDGRGETSDPLGLHPGAEHCGPPGKHGAGLAGARGIHA